MQCNWKGWILSLRKCFRRFLNKVLANRWLEYYFGSFILTFKFGWRNWTQTWYLIWQTYCFLKWLRSLHEVSTNCVKRIKHIEIDQSWALLHSTSIIENDHNIQCDVSLCLNKSLQISSEDNLLFLSQFHSYSEWNDKYRTFFNSNSK